MGLIKSGKVYESWIPPLFPKIFSEPWNWNPSAIPSFQGFCGKRILKFCGRSLPSYWIQLLDQAREKNARSLKKALYLVDSSTFSLNKTRYPWAAFRKTKAGIKLHLKLCFMDKQH